MRDNENKTLVVEKPYELNEENEKSDVWDMRLDIGRYSIYLKSGFDADMLKQCLGIVNVC